MVRLRLQSDCHQDHIMIAADVSSRKGPSFGFINAELEVLGAARMKSILLCTSPLGAYHVVLREVLWGNIVLARVSLIIAVSKL